MFKEFIIGIVITGALVLVALGVAWFIRVLRSNPDIARRRESERMDKLRKRAAKGGEF